MEPEYKWLELRPQQRFGDDGKNLMLDVIRHVSDLGFFVISENDSMRIVVRARRGEQDQFKSIAGITPVMSEEPHLGNMVVRCLVPRERNSLVPIVGLNEVTRGRIYHKMWSLGKDCVMACFFYNRTKQVLAKINARLSALEATQKSGRLSAKKASELEWATRKRGGQHSYYRCLVAFGVRGGCGDAGAEAAALRLASGVLLNSFAHRLAARRGEFRTGTAGFLQKLADALGGQVSIDPFTFAPKSFGRAMVLTDTELAYFVSLPEEHDVRTINFGMGATPTFVHGMTQDVDRTDLTSDFSS
ncbi:MAG TPA: hypothetical protein VJ792_06840 [Candidatus Nitrosotalea sp.]|nr:hypothetical protein [Candidatus Nitrosotalea sp.]